MHSLLPLEDRLLTYLLARRNLKAVPKTKTPKVLHPNVWQAVRGSTMVDSAQVDALYSIVREIVTGELEGDLVECGVWRGGASMTMALALQSEGSSDRVLWLYDTFAGMTPPGENDVGLHDDTDAQAKFTSTQTGANASTWCAADLETVRTNMLS